MGQWGYIKIIKLGGRDEIVEKQRRRQMMGNAAGLIRSGSSSRISKQSSAKSKFNFNPSQYTSSKPDQPSLVTQMKQLNVILQLISQLLFESGIKLDHFDELYEEYGRLASSIVRTSYNNFDTTNIEMSKNLFKQIKRQERKREKLENDLDNLFEGARMSIYQKEEIIRDLEERLRNLEDELNKRDKKQKQQAQTIEFLKNKIDRQQPAINRYLPSITVTQPKQSKLSSIASKQQTNLKPPLPQHKSHHIRQSSDPSINISSQFSSDFIRMLLLQAISLQVKFQEQKYS